MTTTWTTTQTEVTWIAVDDPSVTWTVQVGGTGGGGAASRDGVASTGRTTIFDHDTLTDPIANGGRNLNSWPDGSSCGFFAEGGTVYMAGPGGDVGVGEGITLTEVVGNDPALNRSAIKFVAGDPVASVWTGGGPIIDTGTTLYVILHTEELLGGSVEYQYLGLGKSTDRGNTWSWVRELVMPQITRAQVQATPTFNAPQGPGPTVTDGTYAYIFFTDRLTDGTLVRVAVGRVPLATIETAPFQKWTGTAWSASGDPAPLIPNHLISWQGYDVVEHDDGYGVLAAGVRDGGTYYYHLSAVNQWDGRPPQLVDSQQRGEELYRTYWSGDVARPKYLGSDGGTLFLVAADSESDRWDTNTLDAVTLTPADYESDLTPYQRPLVLNTELGQTVHDMGRAGTAPTLLSALDANSTIILPPIGSQNTEVEVVNLTDFVGAPGPVTVTCQSDDSLPLGVPVLQPWDCFRFSANAAQRIWVGRSRGSALPPTNWRIIPASRFVSSPDAGYGSPLFSFDSTSATVTLNGGTSLLAPSDYRITDTITKLIFEVTASSLTSGQSLNVVCYNADEHGLPTTLRWSKSHVVGTLVQVHQVTVVPSDGVNFPFDGSRFLVGIHNPNNNSVTLRGVRPDITRFSGAGGASFGGISTPTGQTTPDADMSSYSLHSSANTSTRLGVSQTVPWVAARS
jgi:hypothetical protein